MDIEELAKQAVDCGFKLHKELGPGLLESVYEILLAAALEERGLSVRRQVPVPIRHNGVVVDNAFKIDLLIEDQLIIELKSTERDSALYPKQLLTYLRLMDQPLGLLMNFGQETFKQGIKRVVNNHR
ncbi:GxxExxY protein [Altererythrobacter litoralis]|uniref:GxxExxY protein n=1 Tax=Altererythrobacter litoralis TaxID=3113904 RepID=A0ABU7GB14_9SPHN|nr:GxxExxY protein [Erythrobacteraceae bacterium 1XM1-14]